MKRLLPAAGVILILALAPVIWILFVVTPRVRGDLVTLLAERYGQAVTIGALHWRFGPMLAIQGDALTVRRDASASGPPLIAVDRFRLEASWRELLTSPRRVRLVTIDGLRVTVPPRTRDPESPSLSESGRTPDGAPPPAAAPQHETSGAPPSAADAGPLVVERLVATNARVELVSSRADKPSRVFEIEELTLGGVDTSSPLAFDAVVINPTPPGRVTASGRLGPWNRAIPSRTPISGRYELARADLGVFRGISGALNSEGTFEGQLDDLGVKGEATIPDFMLNIGQAIAMRTRFDAHVSDRGGDVALERVTSAFGETTLGVMGQIVRSTEVKGRTIDLEVQGGEARIEDLLRLALEAETPPVSGRMRLRTHLVVPAGPAPVISKMRMAGEFIVPEARFANTNVQRTLERISRMGGGATEASEGGSVVSNLSGVFALADGLLSFEPVRFAVPGFAVELVGTYGLESEALDLAGRIRVARTPSQMASGSASRLLELADRLLAAEGGPGIEVPVSITGPRSRPTFRIDPAALNRGLGRNLQRNLEEALRRLAAPPRP